MNWLDAVGWGGSVLLVYSLMQARVLRFRAINLAGCVVLTAFNAALGIWPMVALNLVLSGINVWFLVLLLRARHDEASFEVLRVRVNDAYVAHVLKVHGDDIQQFQPDFPGLRVGHQVFLIERGDETVGVVVLQVKDDVAHVVLDYVTPRYRDFSPGEFVWRRSDLLDSLDVDKVVTSPRMLAPYYGRVGFRPDGDSYVLDVG